MSTCEAKTAVTAEGYGQAVASSSCPSSSLARSWWSGDLSGGDFLSAPPVTAAESPAEGVHLISAACKCLHQSGDVLLSGSVDSTVAGIP